MLKCRTLKSPYLVIMKNQVRHSVTFACGVGLFLTQVFAQGVPDTDHSQRAAQAKSACAPFQGRQLSMVIPVKPGGGFDLMGRALEPFLATHSGMSVAVSNVAGGSGVLAIKAVTDARASRPVVGLINLGTFGTQAAAGQSPLDFSRLVGLGVMSTDHAVWVSRQSMDWANATNKVMTSASPSSPYVRFGMPAKLLGLNLRPIFGYEGTNEAWMALLRGELDLVTMSDYSAKRNLSTGASATVSLTLTDRPHPDFPGVPHLAGAAGMVDLRSKGMAPDERKRLMDQAGLTVMLSEQARTLVASARLDPAVLKCLRLATQAALFDPALADVAKRQKFGLSPETPEAAQKKMQQVARALSDNRDYLRAIAAAWKEGN